MRAPVSVENCGPQQQAGCSLFVGMTLDYVPALKHKLVWPGLETFTPCLAGHQMRPLRKQAPDLDLLHIIMQELVDALRHAFSNPKAWVICLQYKLYDPEDLIGSIFLRITALFSHVCRLCVLIYQHT